jgi:hypothetical protein
VLGRYTEWVGGTFPALVDFPHHRSARASRALRKAKCEEPGQKERADGDVAEEEEAAGRWVHLMRLHHPLLYGWYLKDLAAWSKVLRSLFLALDNLKLVFSNTFKAYAVAAAALLVYWLVSGSFSQNLTRHWFSLFCMHEWHALPHAGPCNASLCMCFLTAQRCLPFFVSKRVTSTMQFFTYTYILTSL